MSIQIQDIVLYGPPEEPRVLSLRLGQLNIVTGASKRGKSALIAIVDYCLGASECNVAVGPIRDTVQWYGLRLVANGQQIFVARQAPASGEHTNSNVYYEVAASVDIPPKSALTATTNVDTARELLSRAVGIVDNLHEPPVGQTRHPVSASIKHALFFCFQPQYEIINPKILFYRQSEPYIPQLIQDALPYFLGAVADDHLVKLNRVRKLRHERRKVEQSIAETRAITGQGASRAYALLSEASDVGLVRLPGEQLSFDQANTLLREVLERRITSPPEGTSSDEYERLLDTRDEQIRQLRRVETDLQGVRALIGERRGYATEGAEHVGRLRTLNLFQPTSGSHMCPLCSSAIADLPADDALASALTTLETKLATVSQDSPHLEQLAVRLEDQAGELRSGVTQTRQSMETIERTRHQLAAYREAANRAAHIRGRISIYLEALPALPGDPNELASRAESLDAEIEALEEELSQAAVEEKLDSVVSVVSEHITTAGRRLDLEHSKNPLRFNPRKLTVIADTPTGPIPMDKMGSGANWVGYHIAVHVALHTVFVDAKRPVPRFLFLDQPSQVYFPADRDTEGQLEVAKDGRRVDEDRSAVLRMFQLIKDAVDGLGGRFQVIITEHADPAEDWFQAAVVERWRDGQALIPQEWLDSPKT